MPDRAYTEWFRFRSSALPENSFHVIRFTGTEGLNTLFSFTIELASRDAAIDPEALLNAEAEFAILRENAPNALFKGYPARVDQGGHFGDFTFYTVELRPAFWKLTQIRQSAIFLNKTLRDTAEELLNSQRFFQFRREFRLIRDYPTPEFAMQYEESLYDYILFRMEEQGAYFFFAPDSDRVIFADAPDSHDTSAATLSYSPASGLDFNRRQEILYTFSLSQSPLPRQVVLRCYDWKEPNRVIVGKAEVSAKGLGDVYLAGENAESKAEAKRLAKIRAEELVCRSRIFTGAGSVPVLRPGVVFTLADHYSASFNRDYLVTEITHQGAQDAYITLGLNIPLAGAEGERYFYRNSFTCIPADAPYRPARTAPRAKISGVIRAFVDGAANRRAEMDEFGRYKLIFPFDLSGRRGGNASCWIRMAGPQANRDSGLAFPLLPGTEVVVSFIDGNPDWPVITGSLPNGETGSISGRGNPNISGIRTAGGNQLTIDDTDKRQGISLTTAAGFGYHMSSGSVGSFAEMTDVGLKTASVGATELGGAFKSVATGFKVSHSASNSDKLSWIFSSLNALFAATGKAMDTLSEKASNGTVKGLSGVVADVAKGLAPIVPMVDDIKSAKGAKVAPYGAILSAKEGVSKSTLQVLPGKAELVASMVLWMTPRILAALASLGSGIAETGEDIADYADAKDIANQTTLNKAMKKAGGSDKYKDLEGKEKYKKVSEDLDAEIKKKEKECEKLSGKEKTKLEQEIQEMKETKKELDKLEAQLDRLQKKDFLLDDDGKLHGGADYTLTAVHRAIRSGIVSPLEELLPEITALVVTLTWSNKLKKALVGGGMGGVSLASEDYNVNIRAKEPVSVHSKGGILLETKLSLDDADKWGIKSVTSNKAQDLNPVSVPANSSDSWLYKQAGAETDKPVTDYIVAHTDTLGLFANKVRTVAASDRVSVSPTHILKSSDATEPNAQMRMTDAANGVIEATVNANGKILLQRGAANGQMLQLEGDNCVLKNGANVQLELTGTQAEMKSAKDYRLTLDGSEAKLVGGNASVTCKNGAITLSQPVTICDNLTITSREMSSTTVLTVKANTLKFG